MTNFQVPNNVTIDNLVPLSNLDNIIDDYPNVLNENRERKHNKFFSGYFIWFINKDGKLEIGYISYRRNGNMNSPLVVKLPGGCSNFGETLPQTFIREFNQEVGELPDNTALESAVPLFAQKCVFRNSEPFPHYKTFFLLNIDFEAYMQYLRTGPSDDGEASRLMFMVPEQLVVEGLPPAHQAAVYAGLQWLNELFGEKAAESMAAYKKYEKVLDQLRSILSPR